tara:strand:- start:1395 stop:1853 length:459 start_codon:yes stop_codon:yes gene_type:complete
MANIRIKKKYANLVDDCSRGVDAPFKTIAQLVCFCAMYAFNKSAKIVSSKVTGGQEVRDTILNDVHYTQQIEMLAVAHTKKPEILLDNDETKDKRYKIFEDYVNAGLELLKEKKDKNPLDANGLDTVLGILREQTKDNLNPLVNEGMGDPDF